MPLRARAWGGIAESSRSCRRTAPLRWATAWAGAAPDDALAALFERAVWPQAHAVLRHWLSGLPEDGDVGIAAAQKGFVDMGQTGEAERLPDDTGMEHFREV